MVQRSLSELWMKYAACCQPHHCLCFFCFCSSSVPVSTRPGAIRVERGEEGQVNRSHDPRFLECGSHHQDQRPGYLQDDQVRCLSVRICICVCERLFAYVFRCLLLAVPQTLPDAVHQAHPDSARAAGGCREEDLLPESREGRASLLLQWVWRESLLLPRPRSLSLFVYVLWMHCKRFCFCTGGGVWPAVCDQREQQ